LNEKVKKGGKSQTIVLVNTDTLPDILDRADILERAVTHNLLSH